jgi:hypothetical protein
MIARNRINEARRMIYNQVLAGAQAKVLPSGSAGRARLELLAIYSNMKANELVAPQTDNIHEQMVAFPKQIRQIESDRGFQPVNQPVKLVGWKRKIESEPLRFGKNSVRFCVECKTYITKDQPCKHVELAPEEVMTNGRDIGLAMQGSNAIEYL